MQTISAPTAGSKLIIVAFAISALGSPAAAKAQPRSSVARAASQISWSHAGLEELRGLFRDSTAVKEFLQQIDSPDSRVAAKIIASVKEFKLADLAGDGAIELIALVDVTGRGFFNNVITVSATPNGFLARELRGWDIGSLDRALVDLDNDGSLEVLVPELLEPYRGANARPPTVVEIYSWAVHQYEKVSRRFPSYYRDVVLPTLERGLEDVERSPEAGRSAIERERLRMLQATYRIEIAAVKRRIADK